MSRGFTLIELLVVIAIIGMLSSVILGALNNARGRSTNTAVRSNLSNLRSQATIFYDSKTTPNYTSLCTDGTITKFTNAINQLISPNTVVCQTVNGVGGGATNQQGYFVYAMFKNPEVIGGTTYSGWCVDYLGTSKGLTTTPGGTIQQCP